MSERDSQTARPCQCSSLRLIISKAIATRSAVRSSCLHRSRRLPITPPCRETSYWHIAARYGEGHKLRFVHCPRRYSDRIVGLVRDCGEGGGNGGLDDLISRFRAS